MFDEILTKIFGSRNDRLIKQYRRKCEAINKLEPAMKALSDEALQAKTQEFRERIAKGDGKVSICCDIYEDNVPMRELLLSYGYQFCGNVEIRSRFGRVKHRAVFERVL